MADDKKDEKFVETEEIDEDLELPDGAAIAKEVDIFRIYVKLFSIQWFI